MKKQLKSFRYAFDGIAYTVTHEGHFRFHLVAAAYVIFFAARFYHLSGGEWAALLTLITLVLSLEIINTAIERLCDRVTKDYDKIIKAAKDAAAGAVLVSALFAVAVAVILFWDTAVFLSIWEFYTTHIIHAALLLLSAVLAVLFVLFTPKIFHTNV